MHRQFLGEGGGGGGGGGLYISLSKKLIDWPIALLTSSSFPSFWGLLPLSHFCFVFFHLVPFFLGRSCLFALVRSLLLFYTLEMWRMSGRWVESGGDWELLRGKGGEEGWGGGGGVVGGVSGMADGGWGLEARGRESSRVFFIMWMISDDDDQVMESPLIKLQRKGHSSNRRAGQVRLPS